MLHGILSLALIAAPVGLPAGEFWNALHEQCGKAFEGRMTEGTEPADADFGAERMVMHVSECGEKEIRIPFHVGENRSRTWVLTRDEQGVRLKHDHRHEDGSPDEITWYGGDARAAEGLALEFPADSFTADMLPAAASNIWTIAITPGETFVYALRREAGNRRFRVEFDLGMPVEPPPPAW